MATKVLLDADQYLPPMPKTGRRVESLTENDVLLGRGKGLCDYIGNVKYRDYITPRKDEYNALTTQSDKGVFAWEVYHGIRNYGGRFLQLAKSANQPTRGGSVEEIIWEESSEKVALAKIKQSLREKPSPPKASTRDLQAEESKDEDAINDVSETSGKVENEKLSFPSVGVPSHVSTAPIATLPAAIPQALPTNPLPPTLFGGTVPTTVDPCLLLFQQPLVKIQQQLLLQQHLSMQRQPTLSNMLAAVHLQRNVPVHGTSPVVELANATQNPLIKERIRQRRMMLQARAREILLNQTGSVVGVENEQHSGIAQNDSPTLDVATSFEERLATESPKESENASSRFDGSSSESESEKEDAAFTLSALFVAADRPKFTEQDEILEQATLTDEEKAAALCDIFGKFSADDTHQSKRPKIDLDRKSIDFLLDFMRLEIERMPIHKKQALLEAQAKCPEDEFSNARLEGFLRCDGMNASLAAERFVNYWEGRREVFGEKYLMRLTLAEALRDDIVAVEAGVHRLLPLADAFGRRIMFIEPHRHTRRGYSSESLVRALWYLLEVFIEESGCDGSGFITIVWDKHTTPFDYDSKVHDKMVYLCRYCLPMKTMPVHICCAPVLLVRLLKPIMKALMGKDARARFIIHDCPESGILDALAEYGIEKHMLPLEMEGTIQLDQDEWIADRRAIEMEELQ